MDLSAQEVNLFVPHLKVSYTGRQARRNLELPPEHRMDIWIAGAVALLLVWLGLVVTTDAPGWVHLLLTGGMFLLIWRIVVRGTPSGPRNAPAASTTTLTAESTESNKNK